MITSLVVSLLLQAGLPRVSEVAASFREPPQELASHVIWGWEGPMDIETIRHDMDSIRTKGFRSVIFEAGYRLPYEYLSEDWFRAIRTAVLEAKARGLKVWIIDEGKYPSGFAGGKFTRERPDLRMKALVVKDTVYVDGKPVLQVGWDYRTGQTRAVNNPTGGKDTRNSQCDYLDPAAIRQFIDWTHEEYKKAIGDEFGKTFLGFRGDEPDFSYLPWTDSLDARFLEWKGYDPAPYYATLFDRNPDETARRFRADYFDVWSRMFADSFFKQQADWCAENGVSYVTHLNKDHDMPECVRVEGSFFRDLAQVQIPGVDAIWNQIWPGTVNDFPKFASSVSHVYGKQRAFSESFAAYNTPPTVPIARYCLDYQMVRGINFFEFMFWIAGSRQKNWMTDPAMRDLVVRTDRLTYLHTQGIPGARIAVLYPTSTLWLGDRSVAPELAGMATQLLHHQRDFDWVDEDALAEVLEIKGGALWNRSGQAYGTLIIPSCEALPEAAWDKVAEFARRGGKVLFWGRKPSLSYGRTFRDAEAVPALPARAFVEPSTEWTATVAAALPVPELTIEGDLPLTYTRRQLADGDLYTILNECGGTVHTLVTLDGTGLLKQWNGEDGSVPDLPYSRNGNQTTFSLTLGPWESITVSLNRGDKVYNVRKLGVKGRGRVETAAIQAVIDRAYNEGGGTVVFPKGKYLSGALFFPRGVNLRVEKGATLQGTANPNDYPVVATRFEGIERDWRCAFLNFDGAKGVRVEGEGTVDGNGLAWNELPRDRYGRPRLLCLTDCDGGSVRGLRFRNQACWCLHLLYTQGFTIDGVDIEALDYIPSSDGIDIDSSCDVVVRNSFISVHDDCISIKSGKDADGRRVGRPSEDILIEDCHFGYGHGAITMGSEISGDIRRVTARRCRVDGDNWAPIRFKSQPPRGGVVEDILFEDIEVENVRSVFDVILEWRSNAERDRVMEYADPVTRLRNVTVRNVHGSAGSMGRFSGFANEPIGADVFHFENCSFATGTGLTLHDATPDLSGMTWTVQEGDNIIKR